MYVNIENCTGIFVMAPFIQKHSYQLSVYRKLVGMFLYEWCHNKNIPTSFQCTESVNCFWGIFPERHCTFSAVAKFPRRKRPMRGSRLVAPMAALEKASKNIFICIMHFQWFKYDAFQKSLPKPGETAVFCAQSVEIKCPGRLS